jgi:catechol 2,3-dioxygenase-like lactoylglutathione lyase family enzyme
MLAEAELVAFLGTSDPGPSRAFYEGTLGLTLTEQTEFACVYRTRNAELRVTTVPRVAGAPFTVAGWRVPDIAAAAVWLRDRGVPALRYEGMTQDENGIWLSPAGARILWFNDPDGNVLSLTQR